ncbi:MAG: hypothetical protein QXJ07_05055 [Candidatus Bathyarchaeia archaeon]
MIEQLLFIIIPFVTICLFLVAKKLCPINQHELLDALGFKGRRERALQDFLLYEKNFNEAISYMKTLQRKYTAERVEAIKTGDMARAAKIEKSLADINAIINNLQRDFDQIRRTVELTRAISILSAFQESYTSRRLTLLNQAEKAIKRALALKRKLKKEKVDYREDKISLLLELLNKILMEVEMDETTTENLYEKKQREKNERENL